MKTKKVVLKNKIDHLVEIDVLRKANWSEWEASTFSIAKKLFPEETIPRIRVVSYFKELNE